MPAAQQESDDKREAAEQAAAKARAEVEVLAAQLEEAEAKAASEIASLNATHAAALEE